jgi:hypothetical protein
VYLDVPFYYLYLARVFLFQELPDKVVLQIATFESLSVEFTCLLKFGVLVRVLLAEVDERISVITYRLGSMLARY